MTTASIVDTRGLTPDLNDIVYIAGKGWRVPPIAQGGWALWCPAHEVFLAVPTRAEARKGTDTLSWCAFCINDAARPKELNAGVDLSTLRNNHSFECDCFEPWKFIRLNLEREGIWSPRCAGCGATPTFIHHWAIPSGERYGTPTDCACGFHPWVGGVFSQAALEIHLGEHKREAI